MSRRTDNRYLLLLSVLLLAGCFGLPPEPKGLPRTALLHNNLPGILTPDSPRLKRCDANTPKVKKTPYCQKVYQALAGDGLAALQLAEAHSSKTTLEEKLYWYNVAAENDDIVGMYKLGTAYYDEPFVTDPASSSIRGLFWLKKAAQTGSKLAEQQLKVIQLHSDPEQEGQPQIRASKAGDGEFLKCGEPHLHSIWNWSTPFNGEAARIKCEDIPALEKQALAGDVNAASQLWAFFAHIQNNSPRKNSAYWETVAAHNGSQGFIGGKGSTLWHESGLTNKIRGRFWMEKAVAAGDESAKRELQALVEKDHSR